MNAQIKKYILHIKNNPFDDIYEAAKRFFNKKDKLNIEAEQVMPELVQLMPVIRTLVEDIVKDYTNVSIAPDESSFTSFVTIKKPGEKMKELKNNQIRTIK